MKNLLFTFLGILILSLLKTTTLQGQSCSELLEHDRSELLKLYRRTTGFKWKDSWNLSQPVSIWYGVTLTADGCSVKKLDLSGNGLSGGVYNLNLPKLEKLDLSDNELSRAIPNFDLPKLKYFYLNNNQLSGSIPNFDLPELRKLNLSNNQLNKAIPNFNHLPKLRDLNLSNNQLGDFIPNFDFPNLSRLNLSNNELSGSVPNFYFQYLYDLNLANNNLEGAIPNFNFQFLYNLNLSRNQLSGDIPNFDFEYLDTLNLASNQLEGAIPNFDNMLELKVLNLSGNLLNDTISPIPDFDNLPKLKELYLGHNTLLSGNVPNFNHLLFLKKLYLNGNRLSGEVPDFGHLTSLEELYLNNNRLLSGSIPNFDLPNLQVLNLDLNKLSGSIPNFNLPKLEQLSLGVNKLSGSIPNFYLPNLKYLYLDNNKLEGSVPNFNSPKLDSLYLDFNKLSGPIPNFNSRDAYLNIRGNGFTFEGLEDIVLGNGATVFFGLQKIIPMYKEGNTLSVSAGGSATTVYVWYKDYEKYKTIEGDSTLALTEPGIYYCKVTNHSFSDEGPVLESYTAWISSDPKATSLQRNLLLTKEFQSTKGLQTTRISSEDSRIVLFPNPAQEIVYIKAEGAKGKQVEIKVFDRLGTLRLEHSVKPSTNARISLDVRSLSVGYYYVQIEVKGKTVVTKPLIISK